MTSFVIEVVGNDTKQFLPMGAAPLRVGRAFDNDVIVGDPTVSAHHLRIFVRDDGTPCAENTNDENGTFFEGRPMVGVQPLTNGSSLELGHTTIRIFATNAQVAPTVRLKRSNWAHFLFASWIGAALMLLIGASFVGIESILSDPSPVKLGDVLENFVVLSFVLLGVSTLAAAFLRISTGHWHYASALALAGLGFMLVPLVSWLGRTADYILTALWPSTIIALLAFVALLPFIAWHVLVHSCRVARVPAGVFILCACTGFMIDPVTEGYDLLVGREQSRHFARYPTELSPLDVRFRPDRSIDEFIERAMALQPPVEEDGKDETLAAH